MPFAFDKQSTERIGPAVRKIERQPTRETVGAMASSKMVPFQFVRFELESVWLRDTSDSILYADAYRRTFDFATQDYKTDTSATFRVYQNLCDVSELVINTSSGTESVGSRGLAMLPMDVTGGRWEVVAMDNQIVRFELTNDTPSNYIFNPGDSKKGIILRWTGGILDYDDNQIIDLTDPMKIFSGHFSVAGGTGITNGTRGLAKFRSDHNQWEIIEKALGDRFGKASANWVKDSGGNYVMVQPCKKDGTIIVAINIKVYLGSPAGISPIVKSGEVIAYHLDEVEKFYISTGHGATAVKWAKVDSGFTNQSGSVKRSVAAKECDIDGGSVGGAVTVFTPIRANKDTALFTDYVVGYVTDNDGNLVIMTDCYDDAIGTIKLVKADAAIRDGWAEFEEMKGNVAVGLDAADADFDAYGDTGGAKTHTHLAHGTADIDPCGPSTPDTTVLIDTNNHETVSSLQPYYVLKYIERDD